MTSRDRVRRVAFVVLVPLLTCRLLFVWLVPDGESDVGQIGVLLALAGGVLTSCVCLAVVLRGSRGVGERIR